MPDNKGERAFGRHLANCFRLPEPPSHVMRTLQRGVLAVSELEIKNPTNELT